MNILSYIGSGTVCQLLNLNTICIKNEMSGFLCDKYVFHEKTVILSDVLKSTQKSYVFNFNSLADHNFWVKRAPSDTYNKQYKEVGNVSYYESWASFDSWV